MAVVTDAAGQLAPPPCAAPEPSPAPAPTAALAAVRAFLAAPSPSPALVHTAPTPTLLLSGPPGVGKTHAVRVAAAEAGVPLHLVTPSPRAAERLRAAFASARSARSARAARALVFLDELDALCPSSTATASASSPPPVAALLAALLDPPPLRAVAPSQTTVLLIAATNRPSHVHPAVLRPPRLCHHVRIPTPDAAARVALLAALLPPHRRSSAAVLAARHPAAVVADLAALAARDGTDASGALEPASQLRSSRTPAVVSSAEHTDTDTSPWDAVVGAADAKRALARAVEWPMRHAETFRRLAVRPARGVLLHGPPGAAKTALVRAAAAAAQRPLFALSAADVYSPFLGEAERQLREAFASARAAAPALLFLDELDGLVGRRGVGGGGGADVSNRVLSTLLTEMDGVAALGDVLVVAATNRLGCIDDALLRPGRFDEVVRVGLPSRDERVAILQMYVRPLPLAPGVSSQLDGLADRTHGWSGARLKALCAEAGLAALRERGPPRVDGGAAPGQNVGGEVEADVVVEMRHLNTAVFSA